MDTPRYLTVAEAAAHLRMEKDFIYRLCARKEIEFVQMSAKAYRIRIDELDRWLAARTIPAADAV